MFQATAVVLVGKGSDGLDSNQNLARLVLLLWQMGGPDLGLLQELLQTGFVVHSVLAHQLVKWYVLEEGGIADIDVDQDAAGGHADAGEESPHGIQASSEVEFFSALSVRESLSLADSGKVGSGLGVVVQKDVESLGDGTLVGILSAHVGRGQVVEKLADGQTVGELDADLVLAGIGERVIFALSAVCDVDDDLVPVQLLPGYEGGFVVGDEVGADRLQLRGFEQEPDELLLLLSLFLRSDSDVVAMKQQVLLRNELEIVGPEGDGSASGAKARPARESIGQRQVPEALGAGGGLLDGVLGVGDMSIGFGDGVGRVSERVSAIRARRDKRVGDTTHV